jgi:hypothetical protein
MRLSKPLGDVMTDVKTARNLPPVAVPWQSNWASQMSFSASKLRGIPNQQISIRPTFTPIHFEAGLFRAGAFR